MHEKTKTRLAVTAKIIAVFALLYFFICSLHLLTVGVELLIGQGASDFFTSESSLLNNPVVGLMIGVLGTVVLQSSSAFTSIIISVVGPKFLSPEDAVPIIMGSNIGTSVTSTLVAMTQVGDRNVFRRAFAAATVHDMFNWCTVIVMLTLEVTTGFLYWLTDLMAEALVGTESEDPIKTIRYITDPLTDLIVQINSTVLDLWLDEQCDNCTLLKIYCPYDSTNKCDFLLNVGDPLEDWVAGLISTLMALFVICGSLILMVKILNSLFQGTLNKSTKRILNYEFKNPILNYLYGYVVVLFGAALTFLIQSSSVVTSTLTPLVGMGLLELETVYPLFLGANLGTTATGILAALAADDTRLQEALQVSLVHLFFNLSGILLFYPIKPMRIPIPLSRILGNTTAKYRWFALAYLIGMFVVLPLFVLAISLEDVVFMAIGIPILVLLAFVVVVNFLQRKFPRALPAVLRNWDYLPKPLHSLKPYDDLFAGWACCKRFHISEEEEMLAGEGGSSSDADNDDDVESGTSEKKKRKLERSTSRKSSSAESSDGPVINDT